MEDKFKVFYHDNGLLRQENGTPVMAVLLEKEVIGFPDKLIEIAAVEQLKAEIESRKVSYYKLDEININLNCEITALKSKLAKAKSALVKIKNHDGHRHSEDQDYTAEKALAEISEG